MRRERGKGGEGGRRGEGGGRREEGGARGEGGGGEGRRGGMALLLAFVWETFNSINAGCITNVAAVLLQVNMSLPNRSDGYIAAAKDVMTPNGCVAGQLDPTAEPTTCVIKGDQRLTMNQ